MYHPAEHDELTSIVRYIDSQLDAIRASALGLTDSHARETPCRSALSIGGIITHTTYVMRGAIARVLGDRSDGPVTQEGAQEFMASFALADDQSAEQALAEFDDVRREYLGVLSGLDPDAATTTPPAPWHGRFTAEPVKWRYALLHQVEELARHAGHADIIREQLDGALVPEAEMGLLGLPANDFMTPLQPAPGTIGSQSDSERGDQSPMPARF